MFNYVVWDKPTTRGLTYAQKVMSYSPYVYWPLWETSGTNADNLEGTAARDGTYSGVTLNSSTFSNGDPVGLWDGSLDYCNVQTASFTAAFTPDLLTISLWFRVFDAGVWADATVREVLRLLADGNNYLLIQKQAAANTFLVERRGGGATQTRTVTYSGTGWSHLAVTVDQVANEMKVYLNGAQEGATLTAASWAGALTVSLIGAASTGPILVWHGYEAHVALFPAALSAADVAILATV